MYGLRRKEILIIEIMYGQWGQGYPGVDPAQQLYWQQYYAAAGYSQPQQFYGAYGAPMSGMPTAANASTPATTVANPVPPAEPPKEERPPLPAEPPPDDEVHMILGCRADFSKHVQI